MMRGKAEQETENQNLQKPAKSSLPKTQPWFAGMAMHGTDLGNRVACNKVWLGQLDPDTLFSIVAAYYAETIP